MERYWRILGERVVSVVRLSVFADWCLLKLGPSLPQSWRDRAPISLDDFVSKGWLPGSGEKQSWVVKLARGRAKIYISKEQRKELKR